MADFHKPVLVFDWGNTIMAEFPEFSGPMADWPEVAQVDGIVGALEGLANRYTLVIATNATISTTEQIWKAVQRVGLAGYFEAIYTWRELGAKKPDAKFFHSIEREVQQSPNELVMIGDSYAIDVLGAKTAGWRAIWYNPHGLLAPGLIPFQDAEIQDMRDLPAAIEHLSLPDYATSLAWLVERGTPYNILSHIHLVAATAYLLAVWLRDAGEIVNPLLTQRGAMMHDLAKIDSLTPGHTIDHAALARDILLARGQPELAEIANRHMPYRDPDDPRRPLTWEQKLVHYSDKLAEGSRLVPIQERLLALKGRYPRAAQELEESWPVLARLQDEICERLNVDPMELFERLRKALGYR